MAIDIPKETQFKGKYRICNLWLAEPVWQICAELRENCLNVSLHLPLHSDHGSSFGAQMKSNMPNNT